MVIFLVNGYVSFIALGKMSAPIFEARERATIKIHGLEKGGVTLCIK
jgi:hypothetical protein